MIEKKSFVFHFEYLQDIPSELRGQWAMYIIDYAESGTEPTFTSWAESKLWNGIKSRIDSECEDYMKKVSNLKQNRKNKENEPSTVEVAEETEETPDTENELSDTEKTTSDTENNLSGGVYVSEFESETVSDSEFVYVPGHSPGSSPPKNQKKHKDSQKQKQIAEKPCLNDVITYCHEKNYKTNPERFWQYYEESGWGIKTFNAEGKVISFRPIKDWKRKLDEWESRTPDFSNKNKVEVSNNKNVEEYQNFFLNKEKQNAEPNTNKTNDDSVIDF